MVAYSFKRRFVDPIRSGLGHYEHIDGMIPPPKTQTIRAIGKRRHAKPGDTLQLYHGMRSRDCFLIGAARCLRVDDVAIDVGERAITRIEFIDCGDTVSRFDGFAQRDGFTDAAEMHRFWLDEHGAGMFQGLLIRWEPLR